jgi:hypothetical protein
MTARELARLLKPFGIKPTTFRMDDGSTPKGYMLVDLEPALDRYISSIPPKTGPLSATSATSSETLTETAETDPQQMPLVADEKPDLNIRKDYDVADVADKNPVSARWTENGTVPPRVVEVPQRSHMPVPWWMRSRGCKPDCLACWKGAGPHETQGDDG